MNQIGLYTSANLLVFSQIHLCVGGTGVVVLLGPVYSKRGLPVIAIKHTPIENQI